MMLSMCRDAMNTESVSSVASNVGKPRYRPEIDGLRAFAVIVVIINHFNSDILPSGYLGVDMFFVISGYVITSSLSGKANLSFGEFLVGFYERRIKRIYPALFAAISITAVLGFFFIPEPQINARTAIAAVFGVSNLYLYQNSTAYFSQESNLNLFTQTWSLGVEEQFYFLFPLMVWFSGYARQDIRGAKNLFQLVLVFALISVASFVYLYPINQPAAYFLMPPRFWEIAMGSLVFIGCQKQTKIKKVLEQIPPIAIFLLICIVMFFPASIAVVATILVVLLSAIFLICLRQGTAAHRLFSLKKIAFIGRASYSLYLWHWSVLAVARWTIGINKLTVMPLVLLIATISLASYAYIETPFRRQGSLSRRRTFTTFLATSGFLVSSIYCMQIQDYHLYRRLYLGQQSKSLLPENLVKRRLFIVGDSYARDFYTLLPENSNKVNYVLDGCAFFDFSTHAYGGKCRGHIASWSRILGEARKGDIVFAISKRPKPDNGADLVKMHDFLADILRPLRNKGVSVVIRIPFPEFSMNGHNGYLCQKEWFRPEVDPACRSVKPIMISDVRMVKKDFLDEVKGLLEANENLMLIDYEKILCKQHQCLAYDALAGDGTTYDGGHLYRWSKSLSIRMNSYIVSLLKGAQV